MDKWNRLYWDVYHTKLDKGAEPDTTEALNEFALAHSELDLLAGSEVADIAGRLFRQFLRSMERAREEKNPDMGHQKGLAFPSALLAAMHKELGVEGPPVDPETGLRAGRVHHRR